MLSHFLFDLEGDDPLGSSCLRGFKEMFFSQKVVEVASKTFLLHLLTSSLRTASRVLAVRNSAGGVFCVFLTKPCNNTIVPSLTVKMTRAMPWVMWDRTSHSPG